MTTYKGILLRLARKWFPHWCWSGAGVVVTKSYWISSASGRTARPRTMFDGSGAVIPIPSSADRWILTVRDENGKDHVVFLDRKTWNRMHVHDVISADNPLRDVRSH